MVTAMKELSEGEVLSRSSTLLGVDERCLQPFRAEDPFNKGMVLEGALCQKPNRLYGALSVLRVSGANCPQVIFATPKLHYPFGKDGSFNFPPIRGVKLYEKLDGTNVLSYSYRDDQGQSFRSYKLRLSPFLRNGKWGNFLDMWKELMEKYPSIPDVGNSEGLNVSFEMYGSRNEHLIKYENPLDLAVLFAIRGQSGKLVPPHEIETRGTPLPRLLGEVKASEDPVEAFARIREKMERSNRPLPDGKIQGTEGAVWYVSSPEGTTSLWKCKPESVEKIHWATGINKEAVMATCWNLLESSDRLSYDSLFPLLAEEYQEDDIVKFRPHIETCILKVEEEQKFRLRVREEYAELRANGLDLNKDKSTVMRALSKRFPREQMTKVYGALGK